MATLFSKNRVSLLRTPEKIAVPQETKRLPIQTANKLLEHKKYADLMNKYVQLLDFTEEQHDVYLQPLIARFVEFVQNLPETRNSYYSKIGGFLEHALVRTGTALTMCRAYFLENAPDKNSVRLNPTEILWMYTLFSASIFNGVGKVFSDLIIELYDADGKHIDRWSPFEKSMLESKAQFYDYDFEEAHNVDLFSRRVSVLLAHQLMPPKGFAWLSSNKEVLSVWLSLLEDNQRDGGILSPFLYRADATAINHYFDDKISLGYNELDIDSKNALDKKDILADDKKLDDQKDLKQREWDQKAIEKEKVHFRFSAHLNDEKPVTPGSQADRIEKNNTRFSGGIEFLKWLNNQLKGQRLEFNSSIFYMTGGAVFLPTALFEEFKQRHPDYKNTTTQQIISDFSKLQLHAKNGDSGHLHTFQQGANNAAMQGIVLNNPQLILPKQVSVVSQGTHYSLSSADLSKYTHLMTPLQAAGNAAVALPSSTVENTAVESNDSRNTAFWRF